MIRVHKDFDDPPQGLVSEPCQAQKQKALTEQANHNFSSYYYRDGTIKELRKIYNYKCGYCETHESAGASLRVDHYRPKGRVVDAPNHNGYYWLAYEWSNLVLSCEKCNRKKWDHFPLEDETNRILEPILDVHGLPTSDCCRTDKILLLSERPSLVNPELDDPDKHLVFLPNGTVQAKTKNGTKSIDLYFLTRDELIANRKNMTDDVVEDLKKHLLKYLSHKISEETYRYAMQDVYEEASMNRQADKAYSRVANALFDDFETFVVSQFPAGQQAYIRQTFQLYQQGRLWPIPK